MQPPPLMVNVVEETPSLRIAS
ncbi:hypothetical protein [Sicyoidochytrium minutum DNA virus]|nr:hypothetical protein [Sicyoidochytrium minutum DNA virus]